VQVDKQYGTVDHGLDGMAKRSYRATRSILKLEAENKQPDKAVMTCYRTRVIGCGVDRVVQEICLYQESPHKMLSRAVVQDYSMN
jgi:hypothetical protein